MDLTFAVCSKISVLEMLLAIFFLNTVVQATLVLPVERTTGLGCIPVGRTVNYECTVTDDGSRSTIWRGSTLNCPSSSSLINLPHALYEPNGVSDSCGDLSAMSVGVSGNEYTSRLTVTATLELDGTFIECTRSALVSFGNDTLRTGAPPPSPQRPLVEVTSPSLLTVSWTQPSDAADVGRYMFTVIGDCGNCVNTTGTTSVSCFDWTASGQTCFFEVRTVSQSCGFVSTSTAATNVTLAVPTSPSGLSVSPVYLFDGSLQYIDVVFMGVDLVMIGGGIPNEISYSVNIGSLSFTGVSCNTVNQCTLKVNGSQLTEDGLLIVSVIASNAVGSGGLVNFLMPVPSNLLGQDIVNVSINAADQIVFCKLLAKFPDTTPFSCNITYGPPPNKCDMYTNCSMLGTGVSGNNVSIVLVEDVAFGMDYCYTVSVSYGSIALVIDGVFSSICNPSDLGSNPTPTDSGGTVTIPNGQVIYNGVTPGSMAVLTCDSGNEPSVRNCTTSGRWDGNQQSCTEVMVLPFQSWIIAIIVIVLAICGGVCAGYLCGVFCQLLYEQIKQRKCTTILLVLLLFIALGFGLGLLLSYCCCSRKKKCKEDKRQLGKEESQYSRKSPQPPDSLYADPTNTIEHQSAPGTEDQYAMVDRKVKKNTKPKPTPPEALYQDPNTIEHETTVSGDTYAVVDKPKRSSKKKGGPDVVPPASEGLTYADIDLSSKRPKPGSGRQAPQQPGEYPKEHPVEYSSVDHGNTSQL